MYYTNVKEIYIHSPIAHILICLGLFVFILKHSNIFPAFFFTILRRSNFKIVI